ncbi:OadG family protein [Leptotrichia sp. oral taxon 218]|uniref:OadG family protein n=1 Tax=Leptotrichia sp. oral taxon 218 TaxID=712361 RepID=UPI001B8D0655|nr:OadG family protein [Leptotrichia sp. oral taxon 218]QUB96109.1 OadG family protein [Leptotrichia sp. oral taxon 218]
MKSILFGNSVVSFKDAIYITIVSMAIVFFILLLISFVLSFFKYFSSKNDENNIQINKKLNKHNEILENLDEFDKKKNEKYKKFNMEKIKDETMLAALMAALIDASEDNENCYIKVRNIKEIK